MAIETRNANICGFFELLLKCPKVKLAQLLHHLIDVFRGQKHSYANFSELYSLLEWWELINLSNQFFKTVGGKSSEFKNLSSEYQEILNDVIDVRSSDLHECLVEKSHEVSPSYLQSFDWKLKFVLTSDKLSQINESRLSLDMSLSENKNIHLDLNKQELKLFIETLEKAKKMLERIE